MSNFLNVIFLPWLSHMFDFKGWHLSQVYPSFASWKPNCRAQEEFPSSLPPPSLTHQPNQNHINHKHFSFLMIRDREGRKWKKSFVCWDLPAPRLGSLHARGLWVSTWGSHCLTAQCPFIFYFRSFESNQRCFRLNLPDANPASFSQLSSMLSSLSNLTIMYEKLQSFLNLSLSQF